MHCVSGIKSRYHGRLNTVLWEQQNAKYPKQENCTGEVYKKDTEKPHRSWQVWNYNDCFLWN